MAGRSIHIGYICLLQMMNELHRRFVASGMSTMPFHNNTGT